MITLLNCEGGAEGRKRKVGVRKDISRNREGRCDGLLGGKQARAGRPGTKERDGTVEAEPTHRGRARDARKEGRKRSKNAPKLSLGAP